MVIVHAERERSRNVVGLPTGMTQGPDRFGSSTDGQITGYLESIDRPHSRILKLDGKRVYVVNDEMMIAYFNTGNMREAHILISRRKEESVVAQRTDQGDHESPIVQRYSRPKPTKGDFSTARIYMSSDNSIAYIGDNYCITYAGIKPTRSGNVVRIQLDSAAPFLQDPQLLPRPNDYDEYLQFLVDQRARSGQH